MCLIQERSALQVTSVPEARTVQVGNEELADAPGDGGGPAPRPPRVSQARVLAQGELLISDPQVFPRLAWPVLSVAQAPVGSLPFPALVLSPCSPCPVLRLLRPLEKASAQASTPGRARPQRCKLAGVPVMS